MRALTRGLADARDPAWSRDGTRVYFETGQDDDVVLQAIRVHDGGTEIVARLADGEHTLLRPRVSPDGTRLAYTRSSEGQLEVWIRVLADGTRHAASRASVTGWRFRSGRPTGTSVAVDVWRDGHAQVYVADLAGGAITQVSRDGRSGVGPQLVARRHPHRVCRCDRRPMERVVGTPRRHRLRQTDRLWRRAPLRAQPGVVTDR